MGGVAAAGVNPTGAVSLQEFCQAKPLSISGLPAEPHNFLATVAHIITYGKPPKLDDKNRPTFAYGRRFTNTANVARTSMLVVLPKSSVMKATAKAVPVTTFGCKGPETYGNCCNAVNSCDVGGVWPVAIGHPCYGCNEEGIGFHKGIHQLANVENQTPRSQNRMLTLKRAATSLQALLVCSAVWLGWLPVSA